MLNKLEAKFLISFGKYTQEKMRKYLESFFSYQNLLLPTCISKKTFGLKSFSKSFQVGTQGNESNTDLKLVLCEA